MSICKELSRIRTFAKTFTTRKRKRKPKGSMQAGRRQTDTVTIMKISYCQYTCNLIQADYTVTIMKIS